MKYRKGKLFAIKNRNVVFDLQRGPVSQGASLPVSKIDAVAFLKHTRQRKP